MKNYLMSNPSKVRTNLQWEILH